MSRVYETTIIDRKQVAANTVEVSFQRPAGFSFRAGQYIQVGVPALLHSDPKGASRVMSIASSPLDEDKISVAFRDTGSGFKRTLKELSLDSPVIIEGQHGYFTVPEHSPRPVVFVAGGIGITPYLSMARYAMTKGLEFPMTLLYANRNKKRAAYLEELQDLARHHKNFSLKSLFGVIDEQFIRQHVKDAEGCVWHIAGPPAMVWAVRHHLFHMGAPEVNVCFEEFVGY
jgi:ferredoxin-NADP reductase